MQPENNIAKLFFSKTCSVLDLGKPHTFSEAFDDIQRHVGTSHGRVAGCGLASGDLSAANLPAFTGTS